MKLSTKWMHDFVQLEDMPPRAFSEALTMSGSKVEGYEQEGSEIENVVVGQVLTISPHPNADKLVVCSVDVGQDSPITIVTGATNLTEGDYVPVALHGSKLPGGINIKKGKLRGVESQGMMCGIEELGLTANDFPGVITDGIFILTDECDHTLGMDIKKAIGLDDVVFDFEITSNRPDCLSIIGLAREAAVTFHKTLTIPKPEVKGGHGNAAELLNVKISAPDLCYRYAARVVKNVRVAPSPRWLRERLRACGVRPINNIVDITNYVMLEYGQPMHAFDYNLMAGHNIDARRAVDGETITTLDGVERTLTSDMLVIADDQKPMAVAGVMGGEFSSIFDNTNTIVFESACFSGPSVRVTAKKLGMRTESSGRFEKGLDPENCIPALERACQLVELLDAGDVCDGIVEVDCSDKTLRTVPLDAQWINRFLGIQIPEQDMIDILKNLEFKVEDGQVIAPSFRSDIECKADIAEEIARFYGYNKIPSTTIRGSAQGGYTPEQQFKRSVNATMLALGYSEVSTYSFISPKEYDRIRMRADSGLRQSVVIANPLGEDTSIMRTTALPSMCQVLGNNFADRNLSAAVYELATEYIPQEGEDLPLEKKCVVLGQYGPEADFYSIKGAVEGLLDALRVIEYDVTAVKDEPAFHPGRCAKLTIGEKQLGVVGELHPLVQEAYGIGSRAYVAMLDFNLMYENHVASIQYKPLPRFPAVTRDLALVCDDSIPVLTLQNVIRKAAGQRLEKLELFDVYKGKQIPEGKKSVAFSLLLRSHASTLTDAECDSIIQKAIKALGEIGAELRS